MPDTYAERLEATIQHLEGLKARGTKFVPASDETLEALDRPVARRSRTTGPRDQGTSDEPAGLETKPPPGITAETARRTGEYVLAPLPADSAKESAFADLRRRALVCVTSQHLWHF